MWTRKELKERAKFTLKGHYWQAFLVSLLMGLFRGGSSSGAAEQLGDRALGEKLPELIQQPAFAAGFTFGLILAAVMGLVFVVFVASPLQVGGARYFTSACCGQYELSSLGFVFRRGRYLNTVKTQLLCGIKIFLGFLLLIVPGIIKTYAYAMVPYILADNPHLPARRALELSERMMDGHKMELFGLYLSFIGWYLLGGLACGIGIIFVHPYVNATVAQLYMQLRHEALQQGTTTMEELCLVYN